MIPRLAPVLLGLWLTQSASAETVLVRTAEHTDFTRIVVDFTDRPAWTLGRVGAAHELRTGVAGIDYDLGDVYRRIYRNRLLSIETAGPGDLRIVTGCDCALTTALRDTGGLIIDITQSPPSDDDPYEKSLLEAPAPDPPPPRLDLPLIATLTAPEVLPVLADGAIRGAASQLGDRLVREIGQAAELDLVEMATGVSVDSLAGRAAGLAGDTPEAATSPAPPMPAAPVEQGSNLRIVTEAERALTERGTLTSVDPSLCNRLEKVLNPTQWVTEGVGPAGVQIDHMDLIDIRGEANARGFRDLVRGYLYLTFGREAAAALEAAPDDLVYKPLYIALARIVEGRPTGNNALAGMTSCPGHTGLWARLADPGAVAYRGNPALRAAFADWPVQMRRALGPRLAEAYLDAGDEETARGIFRSVARVAPPNDPAFLILAARLADPVAHSPAQKAAMAAVARTRRPESVDALLGVIAARIAEDVPVGADLAMQAGALAFELGDTEDARALRAAEIRALVHDHSWKAAVARLDAAEPVPDRAALLSELAIEATQGADDADLLWLAARITGAPDLQRRARSMLAARIARLGVADMARAALDLGAAIPTADERRILAEIALLEDRPTIAEAYLAGLETEADLRLMTRAATMRTRQTAAAAAGYQPTPDPASPAPPADLPPDLPAGPAAVTRSPQPLLPVVPQQGLEASRALLGQSADLRGELETLLAAPQSQ